MSLPYSLASIHPLPPSHCPASIKTCLHTSQHPTHWPASKSLALICCCAGALHKQVSEQHDWVTEHHRHTAPEQTTQSALGAGEHAQVTGNQDSEIGLELDGGADWPWQSVQGASKLQGGQGGDSNNL